MKIYSGELIRFALQEQEHRDELELGAERVHRKKESWVFCKVWWSPQGTEAGKEDRSLQLAFSRNRDRTRGSAVEDRKRNEDGPPASEASVANRCSGAENARYWRLIQRMWE